MFIIYTNFLKMCFIGSSITSFSPSYSSIPQPLDTLTPITLMTPTFYLITSFTLIITIIYTTMCIYEQRYK